MFPFFPFIGPPIPEAPAGPMIRDLLTGELVEISNPDDFILEAELVTNGRYIYCAKGEIKIYKFRLSEAREAGLKITK